MSETPLYSPFRRCPQCGMPVSRRSRTCWRCRADLTQPSETLEPEPEPPIPWRSALLGTALVLLLLAGGGWWVIRMARAAMTRPTPTSTPTSTPTRTPTPTSTPTPTWTPTPIPPLQHQVQEGETLSEIALRYGVPVEAIRQLNNLSGDLIVVGQVLLVPVYTPTPILATPTLPPGVTPSPTPRPDKIIHVVQPGETLLAIAQRYGVPMQTIQAANGIANPERIQAGQALVIPLATPTPAPGPTPTPTPTPEPTYPPPPLLYPPDGAQVEGPGLPVLLQWASVGWLEIGEWYEVRLFREDGVEVGSFRTRATAWHVPATLLQTAAGEEPGFHTFRWTVQVVRRVIERDGTVRFVSAGPASARTFRWRAGGLSPTPTR
ncbi:LysM peptidoglycan-binding domain-containing protein [Thermoflexus sp.]|uniref:LysM peptidoglycan-binding domain-containing protein n=1 Tax=Thermoflexus sp. TaxID=1969742 RepID=UPI002608D576|nr:LysM peptidoglycan-binding domain-containing protein [Thermoflexus sp.]MCX7691363.1 LysM peptidoglycan-binding domain-containing protein [Thermoflexus sp.]MDW8065475.1 LysM peptidoglycan-binding domain-containing protein [Anaerolineae bacterium]